MSYDKIKILDLTDAVIPKELVSKKFCSLLNLELKHFKTRYSEKPHFSFCELHSSDRISF